MPGQTREAMLAEALAMQEKLLKADPEGYPAVTPLLEPIKPVRGENCIVCVHASRERCGLVEMLVEWSSPPPPSPRLSWIPRCEARKLAPPEVEIFEARERDGGPANARSRKYTSTAGATASAAAAGDAAAGADDASDTGGALGAEERVLLSLIHI